jgi:hypothetical protein
VGAAIGELEVFQEQVDCLQLPPMEEIYQFAKLLNEKMKHQIFGVVAEKLFL